jgi:hypothetical protein
MQILTAASIVVLLAPIRVEAAKLPAAYFPLMEAGAASAEQKLNAHPDASLEELEKIPGEHPWADTRHFPYSMLAPAVLYAKQHKDNSHYHDKKMLALAFRIGDFCASENEKGRFTPRLDSDWDTYSWLETYRLLKAQLGPEREARWSKAIEENIAPLYSRAVERMDYAWYQSPFITTSPNHYAQWAELLYLGGKVFGKPDWEKVGAHILHRFVTVEQSPDGYWGEHDNSSPTIGYDHLTLQAVGVYWEHSKDAAALKAIRRSTDFHKYFTYPDGNPVELMNDRNRYWRVSAWSQFAFSNFADGRRYAEFLAGFFRPDELSMDSVGRLSQDALYYHEGPTAPIPQDQQRYSYRLSIPAGVRKTGPWVVALSGIIDTQAVTNQFMLDRQAHLSVFNQKTGLIITGANSKRQPELATFWEKLDGNVYHMPISSRLQMSDEKDRLSLAYNTFFSDLYVPPPSEKELKLRFVITAVYPDPQDARATLQLVLHAGEELETGTGKKIKLGTERIELQPEDIAGSLRHHGWKLDVDPKARLIWPIYPHNPYANAPETSLEHAVGALSVPVLEKAGGAASKRPKHQEMVFTLSVE